MEMDRGVHPPPKSQSKREEYIKAFNKEMANLDTRLRENFTPGKKRLHWLTPEFVAQSGVPLYLFTITATWYLGMFVVVPVLYQDLPEFDLFLQRCLMTLIYVEMMANWFCIRYVSSSYFALLKARWSKRRKAGGSSGLNEEPAGSLFVTGPGGISVAGPSERERQQNGVGGGGETSILIQNSGSSSNNNNNGYGGGAGGGSGGVSGLPNNDSSSSIVISSEYPWKPAFQPPNRSVFSYWSWTPCYVCEVIRPPRCHHCPVCQACVLKRDHHCYFAGNCVGWRNQRNFFIFVVWGLLGCCYATFCSYHYFLAHLWPSLLWFDLFFPACVARWLLGYVSGFAAFYVVVQSLLFYFMLLTFSFVQEHSMLISTSRTSFEVSSLKKTLELRDARGLAGRVRSVLGRNWLLSFLCPLHWLFDAVEDPENWPSIKVYRH